MPNNIPVRQNEQRFLDLQAAYSQAYDNVAWYGKWQMGLVVGTAIFVPVVNGIFPDAMPWGALVAAVVLIADVVFLEPSIRHYQELGAKVHEVFDTELFELPWNAVKAGQQPDHETIARLTADFMARHTKNQKRLGRMKDWYPSACGALPIEYGRLICQRSSMWWDADLRRQYCYCYIVLIFGMAVVSTTYGLFMGWTLAQFLMSAVAPLVPAAVKIWRSYVKQTESASSSDRARQTLQSTWAQAMNNNPSSEVLQAHSRHLQDELFDRRKNSSRIPDWFYVLKREQFEHQMNFGAEQMVKEAQEKRAPAAPQAVA